jgi:hypothetical protein
LRINLSIIPLVANFSIPALIAIVVTGQCGGIYVKIYGI